MTVRDFTGGINTRLHPTLLDTTMSAYLHNANIDNGILKPVKDKVVSGNVDSYFTYYYNEDRTVSSATETSWVEYRNVLYSSNGTKIVDGIEYPLGIEKPNFFTVTGTSPDDLPPVYAEDDVDEENPLPDTDYEAFSYVYTYYDSTTGVESQPSDIVGTFVVNKDGYDNPELILSPSSNMAVDLIRIYRSGTNLTSFTLVDEVAGNSFNYIDSRDNLDIAGSVVLDTLDNGTPPDGMKYLIGVYATLFCAVGDKVYFSEIGQPNYWSALNFLDFDEDITGMGAVPNGILVFTRFKTYIITGNSPETFSYYLVSSEQGCINHYTIQYVNGQLLWLSEDGICSSNGGNVQVISRAFLGKLSILDSINAVVYDSVYYLSYGNDNIIAVDFKYSLSFRYLSLGVDRLGKFNDRLYGEKEGTLYELLASDEVLEYTYRSPIFIKGSEFKTIHDIHFFKERDIPTSLKLIVDGNKEYTHEFTDWDYNYKVGARIANYVQLELKSKAEMYEYEIVMEGRKR